MPGKNCYLVAAVHARPLFFIGRIRGWLIPSALGHRQVSLDENLFPCPLKTRPPEGWKTPGRRCRGKRSFLAPSMSLDTYPRFNPETAPIKVRPESSARMQQRQRGFPLCPAWLRFWHPFSTSNPAAGCFSRGNISLGVHASTLSGKKRQAPRRLWQVVRLPSGV